MSFNVENVKEQKIELHSVLDSSLQNRLDSVVAHTDQLGIRLHYHVQQRKPRNMFLSGNIRRSYITPRDN